MVSGKFYGFILSFLLRCMHDFMCFANCEGCHILAVKCTIKESVCAHISAKFVKLNIFVEERMEEEKWQK